uniref:EKC/KEOPS complex subunit GON7 n=1 Tax=Pelusios castaneus TaxID=367368 RepID=A0A8C8RXE8_9SAUR
MELRAVLTARDGQKQPLRVRCQPEAGAGGELRGLLRGLSELQEQVTALLAPLVQQESGGQAGPGEDNDDDEDEENTIDIKICEDGPSLKRIKTGPS